jgi:SAM-dependent methyltransferase
MAIGLLQPAVELKTIVSPESIDRFHSRHNGNSPFIQELVIKVRKQLFDHFCEEMRPQPDSTILDVGVTDETSPAANMLEQCYRYPQQIVCAGLSDGRVIQQSYPGVGYVQIRAGEKLPFADRQFDISYSNAVLEHVGGFARQRAFIAELCRVGKKTFLVVPNRWFPIEPHTVLPLLHYLPPTWFRRILRQTRYHEWATEETLNYVSPDFIREAWPADQSVRIEYQGLGVGIFKSNLVAWSQE